MTFDSLNLIEPILRAVKEEAYTTPTPIQQESIPIILQGTDLLGCAQSGTGKTAAFAIPIIQLLSESQKNEKKRKIRSLILTPTRELAIQIGESFNAYGCHSGITNTVIFGGVGQGPQTAALRGNIDVLVATPGRLIDLIGQGFINLSSIEIFVLDEADRMLDMGFIHDVKRIIALLPRARQSLFFSATMPPEIVKLADTILYKPQKVAVTPVSSTVDIVNQLVYFVDKGNKNALLLEILKDEKIKSALVFTRTKHGADKVVKMLAKNEIKAAAIHGNKAQNARQKALNEFKAQQIRVLVATDIAARGIDIDELEYVINFEMSNIAETYVHRIGRTGRAGANGTAISFCDAEEKAYLRDVEKLIAKKIKVVSEHPFPLVDHNPTSAPKQQFVRRDRNQSKQNKSSKPRNNSKQSNSEKSNKSVANQSQNSAPKSKSGSKFKLIKKG
ncbi:MAG: DEAD/DEAH box helicase [Bacteroidales bacterium]|nr:DEAD/DEAH box helicase [Bacteroidales bacterium]